MSSSAIRTTLFVTFIVIFVATAILTLLAIVDVIRIRDGYLNTLFTSLVLEIVAAVIALFRSASFFGLGPGPEAKRIVGSWWELIDDKPGFALSFMEIKLSKNSGRMLLNGEAYDPNGNRVADWRSSIAWLDPDSLQLVYLWSGTEAQVKQGELTGLGHVAFRADDTERATRGFGWFVTPGARMAAGDVHATVELRRASDGDRTIMLGDDNKAKSELVVKVHASRTPTRPAPNTPSRGPSLPS